MKKHNPNNKNCKNAPFKDCRDCHGTAGYYVWGEIRQCECIEWNGEKFIARRELICRCEEENEIQANI